MSFKYNDKPCVYRCLSKLKLGDIVHICVRPLFGTIYYGVSRIITKDTRATTVIGKSPAGHWIIGTNTDEFGFWPVADKSNGFRETLKNIEKYNYGWILRPDETYIAKIIFS